MSARDLPSIIQLACCAAMSMTARSGVPITPGNDVDAPHDTDGDCGGVNTEFLFLSPSSCRMDSVARCIAGADATEGEQTVGCPVVYRALFVTNPGAGAAEAVAARRGGMALGKAGGNSC